MESAPSSNRINPVDFECKRLQPSKLKTGPNHFYVTRKTSLQGKAKKLETALNEKFDEVFVHGLGAAVNKTVDLAFELEKLMGGTVACHIRTSTIEVTDTMFPLSDEYELGHRTRPLTAIHLRFYRKQSI